MVRATVAILIHIFSCVSRQVRRVYTVAQCGKRTSDFFLMVRVRSPCVCQTWVQLKQRGAEMRQERMRANVLCKKALKNMRAVERLSTLYTEHPTRRANTHIFSRAYTKAHHPHISKRGHTTFGSKWKRVRVIFSVSHPSRSLMSLLNVPFVRFPSVLSSPTAQSSRPSASTTSIARSRRTSPSAPPRWSRMAGSAPNTGDEPKLANFFSCMDLEHIPINVPDSHHNFLCPNDATVIHASPEGLPSSGASSSSKQTAASRVPLMFGPSSLWKQGAWVVLASRKLGQSWTENLLQQRFLVHSRKGKRSRHKRCAFALRKRESPKDPWTECWKRQQGERGKENHWIRRFNHLTSKVEVECRIILVELVYTVVWWIIRVFSLRIGILEIPDAVKLQSWKINFRTEDLSTNTADPQITMQWIKEAEMAKSIDELVTSRSITRQPNFPDFRYAWCDDCVSPCWSFPTRSQISRKE